MVKPKYFSLFILLILLAFTVNAQSNSASKDDKVEITGERSMYSKVFLKANGEHQATISAAPVHYKKNGAWEEINTTITADNTGYKNESNVIQSYFPQSIDGLGKIKLIVNQADEIFIHSEKKLVLMNDPSNLTIINLNSAHPGANVTDNTIDYPGIYTGISDEFTVLNGEIKNNVVLNAPPALLNNLSSGYFGFRETLDLPAGWEITTSDNTVNSLTSSSLLIVDAKNNVVLTIPAPVFFDHYKLQDDGASMVEGKYLVKQENTSWTITTLVPVSWLKDANTQYPVSIDPTVVIAGNTGGWQSPNNFVDNPGFVFVGVCCGNLTHRAWVKFNISSIPTNSCITDVEFQTTGVTENSTSPEVIFLNDVTGAFGPYGGINPAAYTDFGTGFYTQFTATTLSVYGYYALGPSACALLQAQLAGGWFQVALQFQNEPSTDWKNFSATSSNLQVTYNAPPCVLPIDLISFDGKCDNSKVTLTWATASQINNDHFTIERSANGTDYETIGTVAGAGNSSQTLSYSFIDPNPIAGTSYYSLTQTDYDGHTTHVKTISVSCDTITQLQINPNPSTGKFIIKGAGQDNTIIVTNLLGQAVFQAKSTGEETEIDLGNQVNGIYFIQIISNKGPVSRKVMINR